ncbi:MAG TPA: S1 RNA-binding domain-containing protein [Candidatus Saccharimonadia bacterium]|nr:S1 RNA-binding domain-containing protein [Candidatus Saccharimonadia bacterium]
MATKKATSVSDKKEVPVAPIVVKEATKAAPKAQEKAPVAPAPAEKVEASKADAPKKAVSPKKKTSSNVTPTSMDELLAMDGVDLRVPKRGDVVEGIVTDLNKKMVLVDIAGKTEGIVVDKEYEAAIDYVEKIKVGDTVSVYVVSAENDRGQILLSFKRAVMNQRWELFEEAMKTEEVVTVRGVELNKGGMIAAVDGIRGFIPTSQFGKQHIGKLESLIGQPIKVKVIEVDKEKNRLIFSERHVSEAQMIAQKGQVMDSLKAGEVYDGTVSGVLPFGVFVAIEVPLAEGQKGKIEGLVHISEISWEKVEDPNKLYKMGDTVKVKVISIDKESGKLNLSVKRLMDDPWTSIAEKYVEGTTVPGVVSRIAPFGVFVNLEPGVDGLIHISKLPAGKEPKVGEKIDVVVEKVEPEARRMRLGVVLTQVPVDYK